MNLGNKIELYSASTGIHCTENMNTQLKQATNTDTKLWAWRGDTIQGKFIIETGSEGIEGLAVKASDFMDQDQVISAQAVEFYKVKKVKAFIGHAGWYAYNREGILPTGPKEDIPDILEPMTTVDLAPHQLQEIWFKMTVAEDLKPGIYEGVISVCSGEDTLSIPYTIEVLEHVQPQPHDYMFNVEYWHHPYNISEYYGIEPFGEEHIAKLKSHMEVYKSLGGTAITVSIVEEAWGGQTYSKNKIHYPSMIKWIKTVEGEWRFDYTHFDKWVGLNAEIGLLKQIICYSMMPWDSAIIYYDEATCTYERMQVPISDVETYHQVWGAFLENFTRHLDDKGWFEYVSMGYDERHQMEVALELVDTIKNKDNKSLKKCAAFNDFVGNKVAMNHLSSISVGLDEIRGNQEAYREEVKNRHLQNKKTTMYTATEHFPNSFVKSQPIESYWTIMKAGSLGADGYLRWAFDAWVENPLLDTTHCSFQAGDCFLIYPECQWSVRLAKLDEGVRDINKLYLLRQQRPDLTKDIDALLGQVQDNYDYVTLETPKEWALAGREAKWATPESTHQMCRDMEVFKQEIYRISKM